MDKDCALKKDGIQRNNRSCGFILGNVFTLFAFIGATTSFDLSSLFFCYEHKRGKDIAMVLTIKGFRIFGYKTTKNMELMEFFHEHCITTFSKLIEACFVFILCFLFGFPTKVDLAQ
jgi:hypothetical protein